jgi:hypothetical protein
MFFLKRIKILLFISLFFLLISSFLSVQARELELNYPQIGNFSFGEGDVNFPNLVEYIFNFAIVGAGIVALAGLVFSGFKYLTSLGNPASMEDARKGIISSLIGLFLLLGSVLILERINPKLLIFEQEEIEKAEFDPAERFYLPDDITGTWLELPIETMIRGVKGKDYGLFEEERLKRIEKNASSTLDEAKKVSEASQKLTDLANQCDCNHGAQSNNGCSVPICKGDCALQTNADGETTCTNKGCEGLCCTSDPCCEVREKIDAEKAKNRESSDKLQKLKEDLFVEKIDFETEIEEVLKTLEIMKEDCLLSLVVSRDNYISLKDYYEYHDEESKEVRYWDDIKKLFVVSYADFYCAVGGSRLGYFNPEDFETPSEDEWVPPAESYLEYVEENPYQQRISCQRTIPFGEIVDEGLVLAKNLLTKMYNEALTKEEAEEASGGCPCLKESLQKDGMVQLQSQLIEKIAELHELINDCLSTKCVPVCECSSSGTCSCEEKYCAGGNPCPMGKIKAVNEEIQRIYEKIEERKEEIFKLVIKDEGEIAKYLKGNFEKMTIWNHNCIAEPEKIGSGWILTNCERAIGTIGPDGEIIKRKSDTEEFFEGHSFLEGESLIESSSDIPPGCKCSNIDECKEEFSSLTNKTKCYVLDGCVEFNFFCCRTRLTE